MWEVFQWLNNLTDKIPLRIYSRQHNPGHTCIRLSSSLWTKPFKNEDKELKWGNIKGFSATLRKN